jgi:hypothetical protein
MDPSDPKYIAMLRDAHTKHERLLSELRKFLADMEANPPKLPPEQLEEGRQAIQNAIESARGVLKSLDEAQKNCIN